MNKIIINERRCRTFRVLILAMMSPRGDEVCIMRFVMIARWVKWECSYFVCVKYNPFNEELRLFVIATRKRNMRGEVDARGDVGENAGARDECEVISTNESTPRECK